jgi:hypothetical protein
MSTEISWLPELENLSLKLIDPVLPDLRIFVEEHEGSIHSNS